MKSALAAFAIASLLALPAFAGEVINVPHFDGIGVKGGGHVILRSGPVQKVTILKGSSKISDVSVNNSGSLTISPCKHSGWGWGSNCPMHVELEVEVITPSVSSLAVSGGGGIEAQGNFPRQASLSVAVNGGGGMRLRAIPADTAEAAVNGGGHIELSVSKSLDAAVNGGGHITYWGNPQVNQAVHGGGQVEQGH